MKKYIVESQGTFFLVFAGTGAIIVNTITGGILGHTGVALVWGLIIIVLIYAIGDISGAHMNPAITIAFWAAKRLKGKEVLPYIVAQSVGAIAASFLLSYLFPKDKYLGSTIPSGTWHQSFVLEVMLTFLLMYVVLNVSIGAKEKGFRAGSSIGATVGLMALFAGPISGASMNPVRSLAPAIVSGHTESLWVYMVATILGAILAVFMCRFARNQDCCDVNC